jgi:hypothetical protein
MFSFGCYISNITSDDLASYRWVDRDMFMHYFGGGIGHFRQGLLQDMTHDMDVDSEAEEDWTQPHVRDNLEVAHEVLVLPVEWPDQAEMEEAEVDPVSDSKSESDLGFNASGSDQDSDDDLGPEDGENSDDDDDNGYASF